MWRFCMWFLEKTKYFAGHFIFQYDSQIKEQKFQCLPLSLSLSVSPDTREPTHTSVINLGVLISALVTCFVLSLLPHILNQEAERDAS